MQPVLDQQKLKALVYYIEVYNYLETISQFFLSFHCEKKVLLNYFPGIRDPVKKFLVSLRDWPVSEQYLIDYFMSIYLHQTPQQVQMGYSSVPHTLYKKKVEELLELHQPFARTPTEWEGCKGSSPQYRGYPCALW